MRKPLCIIQLLFVIIIFSCGTLHARTMYVSSNGSDFNDGTMMMPLKSLDLAVAKADTILLKAGDVFYGYYKLSRQYLGRYGSGPNPVIRGYKRIKYPNWEKVSDNIWRINLAQDNYTGVITGSSILNNIGCIHEYDKDLIHGRKVQYMHEMKQNWDIWQAEEYSKDMDPSLLDECYLYLDMDPNELFLEFAIGECAISMRYSTIENVNFEGFGFGISVVLGDSVVRGCKIDAIGGMALLTAREFVLHGNGICLYFGDYSVKNCIIEGNFISRCYDCGLCLYGTGNKGSNGIDIVFRDNLVTQCCQGIENSSKSTITRYINCIAENNFFVSNGTSGFGYPGARFKHSQILENNVNGPKGFHYTNNLFVDGNFYCAATYEQDNFFSSIFDNNICYLSPEQFLIGDYYGKKTVLRIDNKLFRGSVNSNRVARYRAMTKDLDTKFVIVNKRHNRKIGKQTIAKYLKNHSY